MREERAFRNLVPRGWRTACLFISASPLTPAPLVVALGTLLRASHPPPLAISCAAALLEYGSRLAGHEERRARHRRRQLAQVPGTLASLQHGLPRRTPANPRSSHDHRIRALSIVRKSLVAETPVSLM